MVDAADPDRILSKRKAISALFTYAISLGQGGHQQMTDEILRAAVIPYPRRFVWHRLEATLFAESTPPSLNRATTLVSPYLPWTDTFYDRNMVDRWAAAASAVQYTEEVGQSVVDVLLQITSNGSLRPHVPDSVWALLKKQVTLPPVCRGRSLGTRPDAVLHVRGRGDADILKSYYLHVWSEWDFLCDPVVDEMETSIREDFSGIAMRGHRKELIGKLNHIVGQLDRGSKHLNQEKPGICGDAAKRAMEQYAKLRDALLKVDMEAIETSTNRSPKFNDRFQFVYRF